MEKEFDFKDVPSGWVLCYVDKCPLKERCMRYFAGQHVPPTKVLAKTVLPTVLLEERCRFFKEKRVVKAVRGWGDFFTTVRRDHYHEMLGEMIAYLRSETYYYRYKNGKYLLMPEQQQWIADLFARYGYPDVVHFDNFVYTYDFQD
ncbi:MAG: hypothetical protein IJ527_04040 [Prevotella sp.]|nr:hypothetical protein [Prevotella sp.]